MMSARLMEAGMAFDRIRTAINAADYENFGALIEEYTAWCRARYADDPWVVDAAFSHQALDEELRSLPSAYGPPNGRTFLACDEDGAVIGCCAYRRLSGEICELKRLFVPERYQGRRLGRTLAETALVTAAADGYRLMRLDTVRRMSEAIALYRSLGFGECAPYQHYPERLMPSMLFMERILDAPAAQQV